MVSFEPVDIDYDKIGDEDYKWDDDVIKDLEVRFNKLKGFDETLNESTDEDTIEMTEKSKGGPSASAPKSGGTSGGDKKGGAREWMKNKLKAPSQLLGKLADKALASLSGIIGSILSWILNRAKEVIGWLPQNLWALITGVGVLIYTYFMTRTRRGVAT